jgi:hypothetical protein
MVFALITRGYDVRDFIFFLNSPKNEFGCYYITKQSVQIPLLLTGIDLWEVPLASKGTSGTGEISDNSTLDGAAPSTSIRLHG